jgi:general stress protein 26
MMSTENLNREESDKKLRSTIEDTSVAMMITAFGHKPVHAVPMYTKTVDEQGNIWFLSSRNSEHNHQLEKENEIQLLYSNPSKMEFLSVYGKAEITSDRSIIDELYSPTDNSYFDGKDDPEITAIKIIPSQAFYWDNKSNKYVTLLKLGLGAVTGNDQDIGEKGKLNI